MSEGPNRTAVWVVVAVLAITVAVILAAAGWFLLIGDKQPLQPPMTTGVSQSLAVAAFLRAYVKDDAATMEKLVTARNIPWNAPPPTLPPGVSTDTVVSLIEPYREGDQVVIGNPLVLEVRMTGDGREPTGTVTARVAIRKQSTRTVRVVLVRSGRRWLVDTIDGQPAVKQVESLSQ